MKAILIGILSCVAAHGANYYVTVAGLGGTPDYEKQFVSWAQQLERELKTNGAEADVTTLSGAGATREAVERKLSQIATQAKPEDTFALFLIGHGSFDGSDYKINLPGPDMTSGQLANALNKIPTHRQLVVNMTSCSGASVAALAKKERIVIVATKSGTEKNATLFARYWVDALHDPAADTDKNGTVSALEAFRYAERKTTAYFEEEKLLATEHAMLSDTGNVNAVRDPKPDNGQGLLAASFALLRPQGDAMKIASPEKQRMVSKKEDLETRIDRLKYQKAAMDEADYRRQLTSLLLELARTQAELDK